MELKRHAVIEDGIVTNVIMVPYGYLDADGGLVLQHDSVEIGWTHDGEDFAEPEIVLSPMELLEHANRKQNTLLGGQWHFDLDEDTLASTRLGSSGQLAMLKVEAWAIRNADNASARLSYSNIDNSPASLSPAHAAALVAATTAVEEESFAALNRVSAAILATPPTITTTAEIDSAEWPTPTAP